MTNYREIEDFPGYSVGDDGTVVNEYGRPIKPSITQRGASKITLYRGGVSFTKSVSLLVANAHVYNDWDPEIFDTPIHLDNDLRNNRADNLAWRPRWFAIKYQKQYWDENYRTSRAKVENVDTGETFVGMVEVCQRYGILWVDVFKSCTTGAHVFPRGYVFSFV